ncbi:MAG TPA: TetR/AcrR family transcriptional regulator [Burkholderiales bacterium]|nr:TetR/AcrR family transcriptional regulator [Burkholderiales bacterium]
MKGAGDHPSGNGQNGSSRLAAVVTARGLARRMPRAERERIIIAEAVRFFAEVGFNGDTRELAKRAHVTHPLLFRYFPSKDALVERVYHEVYLGRWNPYWEMLIQDRSIGLEERMVRFYRLYAQTILSYEFVRLLMFAGLRGGTLTRRWFALVAERIVVPICREIRIALGLPDPTQVPLTQNEIELVWGLNSRVFYFGVRKYVYGMQVPDNLDELIEFEVRTFFEGVTHTLRELVGSRTQAKRTGHGKAPMRKAARNARGTDASAKATRHRTAKKNLAR